MFELRSHTIDTLLAALSNPSRRYTTYILLSQPQLTVEQLAARLHRIDADAAEMGDTDRSSIEISLVHNHLPRLADAGLIEYDPRSGELRRNDLESERWAYVEELYRMEFDEATLTEATALENVSSE